MLKVQRRSAISIVRIISMLCIVLCHTIHYYTFVPGYAVLGQLFNVGVYVFLLISGYLYGGKTISKFGSWYLARWKRIVMPTILVVLIGYLLSFVMREAWPLIGILSYVFNVHGLGMISWKLFSFLDPCIANLGPLWFTTIIMMCYALIPALQILRGKILDMRKPLAAGCAVAMVLLAGSLLVIAGINISFIYFSVFCLGYILGSLGFQSSTVKIGRYGVLTALMIIGLGLRVCLADILGDTSLYAACAALTHTILGLWIFATALLGERIFPRCMEAIASTRAFAWLDKESFYIFLTHCLFCTGEMLNVYKWFSNPVLNTILFAGLTIVTAVIVQVISDLLIRLEKNRKRIMEMKA